MLFALLIVFSQANFTFANNGNKLERKILKENMHNTIQSRSALLSGITLDCPDDITLTADPGQISTTVTWATPTSTTDCEPEDCSNIPNAISGFHYLGEFNGSKYYCSASSSYTWHQAKAVTEAAGGHIVVIDDAAENEYVRAGLLTDYAWIGLTDEITENDFKWVNGTPFNYSNWNSGEPNNSNGNEHYVRMLKNNGKWTDRNSTFKAEIVMEIPCGSTAPPDCSSSPNSISGYIYLGEHDGSKYFCSSSSNYTWWQADAAAQAAGGHLAVINDNAENNFLGSHLLASYAWIGYTDQNQEGNFNWVTGEPETYTNWYSGADWYEPNNQDPYYNGADHTVLASGNKKWYDRNGNNHYEFIMEVPCNVSCNENLIDLTIHFDNYSEETSWEIKDNSGNVVASHGTYSYSLDNDVRTEYICLPDGCYTFKIYDSYGDGICCSYGYGSYSLNDSNGNVLASGGQFGHSESTNFCLSGGGNSGGGGSNGVATIQQIEGPANGSSFPLGTTTITYEATDNCGNSVTCSFDVTVEPSPTNLSLDCPDDITVTETAGQGTTIVNWTEPSATTNCITSDCNNAPDIDGMMYVGSYGGSHYYKKPDGDVDYATAKSFVESRGGTLPIITSAGENNFLLNATGGNFWLGMTDEAQEGIFVWDDGSALTYTNWNGNEPNDYGSGEDYAHMRNNGTWNDHNAHVIFWAVMELPCATVNDEVTITQTSGPANGSAFPVGTTTVTYIATDNCGNSETCSFTVTVNPVDAEITFDCPNDITLIEEPGQNSAVVVWTEPTATTTCFTGITTITQTAGLTNGSAFPEGTTTVSYEITDECGNSETCSFDITIDPLVTTLTLTCSTNIVTAAEPGAPDAVVTWGEPITSTTCPIGSVTLTQTAGEANGSAFPIGTTTISYLATDECGNSQTCSFTITVNEVPSELDLICPGDISATALPGETTAVITWPGPTATTTCYIDNVTLTQLAGLPNGASFPIGTTTVGFEATDECGNSEICAFTVNVSEFPSTLTVVTCPADVEVTIPSGATGATVTWDDPTAVTDCPLNNVSISQILGQANGSIFPVGSTIVSYEIIDDCLNLETCSFTVIVQEETSVINILNCPQDIILPVNPDGSNEATVFWTEPGVETDCPTNAAIITQVTGLSNGSNFPLGTSTVEYQATDDCGTIVMCEFSVIIEPFPSTMQINCPPDLTVVVPEGDQTGMIFWEMPVATTTCPVPGTTVTQIEGPVSGSDFPLGMTEIVYQATDLCGNVVTCSFDVNVVGDGTITPNCPVLPDVLTLAGETTAIVSWAEPTGTTTCPQGGVVATQTSGPANGTPFPVGISNIMYSFTDACGNVATCLFKVRVNQNTQPDGYCDSEGISTSEEWIDQVEYITIDNLSGDDNGYGDYTNIVDVVTVGSTTSITLTPGFSDQAFDEYWRVCIDWNQDGDFADPGEIVIEENSTDPITASFTIPTTALNGQTRMRVSMKRGSYPDKCELIPEGEVEDYTLTVTGAGFMASTTSLLSFDAEKEGRTVAMKWVTNTGELNDYFIVERSADGVYYEKLEQVQNTRHDNTPIYFNQVDNNPYYGDNYYRVKQVYKDGSHDYSELRKVRFGIDKQDFTLFPNPTEKVINVTMERFVGNSAIVQIYNNFGYLMYEQKMDEVTDDLLRIELQNYSSGVYLLTVKADGLNKVSKTFVVGLR